MRSASTKFVVVTTVLSLASGCANIQNDTARTKAEGAGVGVLLGSGLGAAIGAVVGGSKGAAIGGGVGAVLGGMGGLAYGSTVAERKLKYANEEDRLNGEIIAVADENLKLREFNHITAVRIQDMRKQITYLRNQHSAGKLQTAALIKKQNELNHTLAEIKNRSSHYNNELVALNEYRQAIAQSNYKPNLAKLDAEIHVLKEQIVLLDNSNAQMAQLISTLSVRK